jgi:N-acetyl-gamma-glutamylphosphate reductase
LGDVAIEICKVLSLQLTAIMDTFQTGEKVGIEISRPSTEIINQVDIVFLAMRDHNACEINSQFIEKSGKIRNSNYFLILNNPCIQVRND